ncbi:hypothetical protein [uncultured Flavobacterium sp.]|uniref:DUF6929 family protein n=1 Tax=uncultured Flavobacterium sp. TaxID=165435 RepID=UPI0030CA3512
MEKFQLQLFLNIMGIGSASGLLFNENSLFLISDNSTYLYEYQIEKASLEKHALVENPAENILKKDKLDFESMALKDNNVIILGSGSTKKRNQRISYDLKSKKIENKDFSVVYERFKKEASLSDDDLNIEGVIITPDKSYFFQRGNAGNSANGIFILSADDSLVFKKIILPKINDVEATFTDAILVDTTIYFLAAVENTTSTYLDGEILGSFLGKINVENLELENTMLISKTNKFEGITLFKESDKEIEFLLCEDNDTEELKSEIYKLTINK